MPKAGRVVLLLTALTIAGCERELTPEEQAMADARDVALVESANNVMPPLTPITPEPILEPDVERFDLYGAACNYAPGTSLGTRVITREVDAFVKIDGEMVRLAADPGSRELPLGTRSLYSGKDYALRLEIAGDGKPSGEESIDYEGTVELRDQYGRIVYEGNGLAQCGG